MAYSGTVPSENSRVSERNAKHHKTRQRTSETDRRRSGLELSASTRCRACVAQTTRGGAGRNQGDRLEGATPTAQALLQTGSGGKDHRKIITALGRELLGFVWAVGTKAEAAVKQQRAA